MFDPEVKKALEERRRRVAGLVDFQQRSVISFIYRIPFIVASSYLIIKTKSSIATPEVSDSILKTLNSPFYLALLAFVLFIIGGRIQTVLALASLISSYLLWQNYL